jgi:hypothetical protein
MEVRVVKGKVQNGSNGSGRAILSGHKANAAVV